MEFVLRAHEGRMVRLHPTDIREFGAASGSLVMMQDSATGMTAVGILEASPVQNRGEVLVDPAVAESLGSIDGMTIDVIPFKNQPVELQKVIFGIKPMSGIDEEESLIRAREWGPSLLKYVEGMVVAPGQQFRWKEGSKINMVVSIVETTPTISTDLVGILKKGSLAEYRFKLITDEPPFNGVLILDLSGSMSAKDMEVRSLRNAIEYISSEMTDTQTREFLTHFNDGEKVERWRGAVLSALMYLVAKVARGKGEKISIVLFSDQAQSLVYNNQICFDATSGGSVAPFAQALINAVNLVHRNATCMARALDEALNAIKASKDLKKMKMIVLLTDGYPNDPELMREVIRTKIAPRMDIVLFVAGIGSEVNDMLMTEIATACGGEYLRVTDLDELIKWYSELARKLTVRGMAKAEPEPLKVPIKVEKAPSEPLPEPWKAAVLPQPAPLKASAPSIPAPLKPVAAPITVPARPPPPLMAAPEGFAVEDIFLMYRDGRLIQHATRRLKADMDVDVVTSMLTAVQEFIKESFGKATGEELGSMEFGDSKITLQKGKYIVLAAVISGPEAPGFRDELKTAVKNIESEHGAVLPGWDGAVASFAGAKRFLSQLGAYQPAAAAPAKPKEEVSVKSELEFYQGFIRVKVAVKNGMDTVIRATAVKLVYNENALRLDHVEPELRLEGNEAILGDVEPREKRTVAFYLDPQICTESSMEGILYFKDARGNLSTLMMPRKLASVVCPILFTDENINTAMIKRMASEELDKKDTKVFTIPPNLTPQKAFEVAKGAVQHHDLRQVREFTEKDPFIGETWYYGKAKGRNERLVVRARVLAEKNVLEFYVASDSVLMLTGMLAELKTDLRKEMETQKLRGGMSQVTDQNNVDALSSIRTLLDRAPNSEISAGDTEAR